MDFLSEKLSQAYSTITFEEHRDPRSLDWFLMKPVWMVTIISSYLYFCLKLGPRLMEHRKPFELKNAMFIYNLFQVLYSTFLVVGAAFTMWKTKFNFVCATIDYSNDPGAVLTLNMVWFYFFGKVTELLDTVFFVLRKKPNQITFLHVFHHTIMVFFTWLGTAFLGGGNPMFFGTLNSFVHIVMYFYYFVAGLGPKYRKYIWWKKHMTTIQLVQFVMVFIHGVIGLLNPCGYPPTCILLIMAFSCIFIYMFGMFYINSYLKKPKAVKSANGVANGKLTNGNSANGHVANGKAMNGTAVNGSANGTANGKSANGHTYLNGSLNGKAANGKYTNGTVTNGKVKSN